MVALCPILFGNSCYALGAQLLRRFCFTLRNLCASVFPSKPEMGRREAILDCPRFPEQGRRHHDGRSQCQQWGTLMHPSIEYLNARHGISRGAIRSDRMRNAVDDRARDASRDAIDVAHDMVLAEFAEFRSWFRNLPSVESIMAGEQEECF